MARAGDRDVAETGVEQVRVDTGVSIYKNALCSQALRAMAGDRITVVEVPMLMGVKLYASVVVESSGNYVSGT